MRTPVAPNTPIEKIAGQRYCIEYDPAAEHQEGGKQGALRSMYQYITCKYGEIYEYCDGMLAWLCTPARLSNKIVRELLEWMEVQVEFDDGAVFLFPVEKVKEVMKWAKPCSKRRLSKKQREEAAERLESFRFPPTSGPEIDPVTRDLVPSIPDQPLEKIAS